VKTLDLVVRKTGEVVALYDDDLPDLGGLGGAELRRASHVEPWGGDWYVDLAPVGGTLLGPYRKRQEALDAERRWLLDNVILKGGRKKEG
jgi:hypothetical protein